MLDGLLKSSPASTPEAQGVLIRALGDESAEARVLRALCFCVSTVA